MVLKVDTGCELAPSCLNCPFPKCVYEKGGGKQFVKKAQRDETMMRLFNEGMTMEKIAKKFNVHIRTVGRALGRK